ncbi:ribonuclease J [Candidatus Microgenomates bacterium]|nr:ribonuclease J [Candidatus Microgenomates bacterium]
MINKSQPANAAGSRRFHREAAQQSRRNVEAARKRSAIHGSAATLPATPVASETTSNARSLRLIPLGGLGEVGRNLNVLEYGNDAIVIDAGIKLGIDLPGINYAIPEFTYLDKIKGKIRGHVLTHGHLDHVGAMPFILKAYPAPVYGSRFTLDMLERIALDRDPNLGVDKRYLNPEAHEQVTIGPFKIELIRVTHSIPDAMALAIDTPAGRIIHTGDFKFDPEPLDGKKADLNRLAELGKAGVLLLMSDSTNCEDPGHTPLETLIEPTIDSLVRHAPGRVVISAISTNINRIQMIINAMVKVGRRVAIDGRSMLANIEMSVRNGYVRIPRGTIVAMRDVGRMPDRELAIISTGHQGEVNSVLMRMATGEHKFIKLKPTDTVILSSSIIPGNEKAVVTVVDRLMREGAKVYQNSTRDIDNHGQLHVSGHANRADLVQMIELTRPRFFMPIHGEYHHQVHHAELAVQTGLPKGNVFVVDNGDVLEMAGQQMAKTGKVTAGTQLVDQTGDIVPNLVIQDRLLMSEDGIVVVMLTLDRRSGATLSSPDIISRGFIYLKDNEKLLNELRQELRHFSVRRFGKVEINRFKQELKDDINAFLYKHTGRSPIIIPVVNVIEPAASNSNRPVQPAVKP